MKHEYTLTHLPRSSKRLFVTTLNITKNKTGKQTYVKWTESVLQDLFQYMHQYPITDRKR